MIHPEIPRNWRMAVLAFGLPFVVGACEESSRSSETAPPPSGESASGSALEVVAYYFHNTIRCESCLKIESLAREAIEEAFAPDLEAGKVEWRVLNMELEDNKRFVSEYELFAPSHILSEVREGHQVKWKNLEDVWALLAEPQEFRAYVQKELSQSLGGS